MKCNYCNNKATHTRTLDLDLPKIPLCDDRDCFIKLYLDINQETLWVI